MEIEIQVTKTVKVKFLRMEVAVRYDEDDMPFNYPHRNNNQWQVRIDLETGQIQDWPERVNPLEFYMKVCDQGFYALVDGNGETVLSIEDNYVPNRLVPGEYGDYIDFKINETGLITNWPKNLTEENLIEFYENDD